MSERKRGYGEIRQLNEEDLQRICEVMDNDPAIVRSYWGIHDAFLRALRKTGLHGFVFTLDFYQKTFTHCGFNRDPNTLLSTDINYPDSGVSS